MEKQIFKALVVFLIVMIVLTAIGKYYEVKQYKKSIENLKLEHEILIKKKKLDRKWKNRYLK